jgi:hypothetical protein
LQACFCGTKGAIDEYLFTCVVLCGGTVTLIYTAKIKKENHQILTCGEFGDMEEMGNFISISDLL